MINFSSLFQIKLFVRLSILGLIGIVIAKSITDIQSDIPIIISIVTSISKYIYNYLENQS